MLFFLENTEGRLNYRANLIKALSTSLKTLRLTELVGRRGVEKEKNAKAIQG